jgi:hypothetical protein
MRPQSRFVNVRREVKELQRVQLTPDLTILSSIKKEGRPTAGYVVKSAQRSEIVPRTGSCDPGADILKQLVSLELELIPAQRTTLIDLRDQGAISDDVLRRYQLLLDLKEAQLEEEGRSKS